jgi:hypothetical protein
VISNALLRVEKNGEAAARLELGQVRFSGDGIMPTRTVEWVLGGSVGFTE